MSCRVVTYYTKYSTGFVQGCIAGYVLCRVNCPSLFCFLHFGRYVTDIVLVFYICCLFVFQKSFMGSFEMTYLNYILDLQGKKNMCSFYTQSTMCVSLYTSNTLCVHCTLKHIMCPLYIIRKTPFVSNMHV